MHLNLVGVKAFENVDIGLIWRNVEEDPRDWKGVVFNHLLLFRLFIFVGTKNGIDVILFDFRAVFDYPEVESDEFFETDYWGIQYFYESFDVDLFVINLMTLFDFLMVRDGHFYELSPVEKDLGVLPVDKFGDSKPSISNLSVNVV